MLHQNLYIQDRILYKYQCTGCRGRPPEWHVGILSGESTILLHLLESPLARGNVSLARVFVSSKHGSRVELANASKVLLVAMAFNFHAIDAKVAIWIGGPGTCIFVLPQGDQFISIASDKRHGGEGAPLQGSKTL